MTPARWKEIEAVFEQARELAESELSAFLSKTCGDDEELRREVESLLASLAEAGDFMDKPSLFFSTETLEETGASAQTGELLGPYRIIREIGRGGMGAVYLAERADQQYQKLVAIKLIKRGMDTESVLRHFRNERQILAGFDHPNIARLFDGGTNEEGLPYFVMEYVEGVPIDRYCDSHGLAIVERLKLFREICAAVTYAHRHAVIHRDIKPSNILVTSEGTPKLLDFGIAKILEPGDDAEALMTATGARPMTPEYASPEQVCGQAVTTASDVYSLGGVLYELLTGRLPYRFASRSAVDVSRAITEQNPERPSTAAGRNNHQSTVSNQKSLRGDLDNIVLMALRKEPARRYESVEQLSDDIRRYLEARPIIARKDSFGYRAAKFVRRNRVATAAAALVVLSLIGGLAATTWQAKRAKVEKARAERRFNDVRQLAHSVLFDYHDAIKDLPGATRVRERLVKDGLAYLDNLAGEAAGDPDLQRELAAAYERLGDVRGRALSASLGDVAGAIESYLKALRIREANVAASQKNVQSRRDLAGGYLRIGAQLIQTNEATPGTDYLRKALAIYLELNSEQPTNSEIRYDLAAAYNELGHALEDWWSDAPGALENHRQALALREEFVAAEPGNSKARRDLSVTYVGIGRALILGGDPKGALEYNQKALDLRADLFAKNPTNADYCRLLAISYQNDGNYRAFLDDITGGLESFRKKLTLEEQSLTDDPANVQTQEDIGFSYERMGDLLAALGDYPQALSYYRQALAMYEKVSAVAPQILRVHYRVIFAHTGIGYVQAKLGDRTGALAKCSQVNALLNEVPEETDWQRRMKGSMYGHLGKTHTALAASKDLPKNQQQEHWRSARNMYTRSLEILEKVQGRGFPKGTEEIAREIAQCDAVLNE